MSVCVFAFFSANWNPIGIPFGTKIPFRPKKVLTQKYICLDNTWSDITVGRDVIHMYLPAWVIYRQEKGPGHTIKLIVFL